MKKTPSAPTPSQKYLAGMPSSAILSGTANNLATAAKMKTPLNPAAQKPKQPKQPLQPKAAKPGIAARGGKKVERMAAMAGAFAPGMPLGPAAGANEPSYFGPLNSKAAKEPVKKEAAAPAPAKKKTSSSRKVVTDRFR